MTNAEIFRTAHEVARRELNSKGGREFYGTYANAFAEGLRAVYAEIKYDAEMDRKHGKGMRPGFQVVEPARVWA